LPFESAIPAGEDTGPPSQGRTRSKIENLESKIQNPPRPRRGAHSGWP
jgi:hypothetical protein